MNVLAIDAGLANTGAVVFDVVEFAILKVAVIKTAKENKKRGIYVADDHVRRVGLIWSELETMVEQYAIGGVVAELPTGGAQSASAAGAMAMSRTLVACLCCAHCLPLVAVRPDDVKRQAGSKTASKAAVMQAMAARWPDLADGFHSTRSASGFTVDFEHAADAAAAMLAAWNSPVIQALRGAR